MSKFRWIFTFSKTHYAGLLLLVLLLVTAQFLIYIIQHQAVTSYGQLTQEEKEWLAVQAEIDSIKRQN